MTTVQKRITLFASLWAAVLVVSFGLAISNPLVTKAQSRNFGWQRVELVPTDITFTNAFMLSGRGGGYVAGEQGSRGAVFELSINALDGWRTNIGIIATTGAYFRAPVNAVVAIDDNNIWAVGDAGLIAHKTTTGWAEVSSPVPDSTLTALQMLGDGSEGWAAGYTGNPAVGTPSPVLLHYSDGKWNRDTSITGQGAIRAIHFGPTNGWAVGEVGIWRYARGTWTKEQEPNPCPEAHCFEIYSSVRAVSDDDAWIAGERMGLCGICVPSPYILHRVNGRWQIALDTGVRGDPTAQGWGRELHGLTFTDATHGWAVGDVLTPQGMKPYILYYDPSDQSTAGQWTYTQVPEAVGRLNSVIGTDADHVIAVGTNGLIFTFGYGPQPPPTLTPTPGGPTPTAVATPGTGSNPAVRVPDPHNANITYFPVVGHTLQGGLRAYWNAHGGLAQFGYPLTEEFAEKSPTDGKTYTVQYFERARFEYHPENQPPYDVLLGLLGRTVTQGREAEAPFTAKTPQPGMTYFEPTKHNMAVQFEAYWRGHGGLPVYGYPISEPFMEVSPTDGNPYLVQYFERNRLEYHPELPDAFRVSLGLLGVQQLQVRGWIPK